MKQLILKWTCAKEVIIIGNDKQNGKLEVAAAINIYHQATLSIFLQNSEIAGIEIMLKFWIMEPILQLFL